MSWGKLTFDVHDANQTVMVGREYDGVVLTADFPMAFSFVKCSEELGLFALATFRKPMDENSNNALVVIGMSEKEGESFANTRRAADTLRNPKPRSVNDWSALWGNLDALCDGHQRRLLRFRVPQWCIDRPVLMWSVVTRTHHQLLAELRKCAAASYFASFAWYRPHLDLQVNVAPASEADCEDTSVRALRAEKRALIAELRTLSLSSRRAAAAHPAAPSSDALSDLRDELVHDIQQMHSDARESYRRALSDFSKTLLSDPERVLYDLVQNVDDCTFPETVAPYVSIDVIETRNPVTNEVIGQSLVLESNETGFQRKDVVAICSLFQSTKTQGDRTTTGYKGIGFKSVFALSSHVTVQSREWCFDLRRESETDDFGFVIPRDPIDPNYMTLWPTGTRLIIRMDVVLPNLHDRVRQLLDIPMMMLWFRRLRTLRVLSNGQAMLELNNPSSASTGPPDELTASGPEPVIRATVQRTCNGSTRDLRMMMVRDANEEVVTAWCLDPSFTQNYLFAVLPVTETSRPYSVNSEAFDVSLSREDLVDGGRNSRILQRAHQLWIANATATATALGAISSATPKYDEGLHNQMASRARRLVRGMGNPAEWPNLNLEFRNEGTGVVEKRIENLWTFYHHGIDPQRTSATMWKTLVETTRAKNPSALIRLLKVRLLEHVTCDLRRAETYPGAQDLARDLIFFAFVEKSELDEACLSCFGVSSLSLATLPSRTVVVSCEDGCVRPPIGTLIPTVFGIDLAPVSNPSAERARFVSLSHINKHDLTILLSVEAFLLRNDAQLPQTPLQPLRQEQVLRFFSRRNSSLLPSPIVDELGALLQSLVLRRGWLLADLLECRAKIDAQRPKVQLFDEELWGRLVGPLAQLNIDPPLAAAAEAARHEQDMRRRSSSIGRGGSGSSSSVYRVTIENVETLPDISKDGL